MGQGTDQSSGGPSWQLCVGIQCDDITNFGRDYTACWNKGGIRGTAQQAIQFVYFPSLAFPANPLPLALIPSAPAVKKEKSRASVWRRPMAAVLPRDAVEGRFQ